MKTIMKLVASVGLLGMVFGHQSWCTVSEMGDFHCYYGTFPDAQYACNTDSSCVDVAANPRPF